MDNHRRQALQSFPPQPLHQIPDPSPTHRLSLSQVVEPIYNPDDGSHSGYRYLASHDTEYYDLTLDKFRYRAIRKLVLSSSPSAGDFSALGIFDGMKSRLIYIRPGDQTWSLIDDINDIFDDIIFYNGEFLVVSNEGDVYAFDFCGPIVQWSLLARGYGLTCFNMRYLVESSGFLMQVCRERDYNEGEIMSRTIHIEVMKLDPKPRTWIPVINLHDQSLFLGTCCSMSVSAADALGLKQNCVYFTDDDWHYAYSPPEGEEEFEMIPDVGVYNMRDGSVEIIHIPDERFNWLPPIWVTPSAS